MAFLYSFSINGLFTVIITTGWSKKVALSSLSVISGHRFFNRDWLQHPR